MHAHLRKNLRMMEKQVNMRLNRCQNRFVQLGLCDFLCGALLGTVFNIGIALKVKVSLVLFAADGAHQFHSRAAVSAHEL